jgi:hypothetical protein
MRRSLLTFGFTIAGLANAQAIWKVGQEVKTTSGTVIGQASKWQQGVSEYLGIPFAKAPEGELRWAAPQAITDASKVINATKYVTTPTIDDLGSLTNSDSRDSELFWPLLREINDLTAIVLVLNPLLVWLKDDPEELLPAVLPMLPTRERTV